MSLLFAILPLALAQPLVVQERAGMYVFSVPTAGEVTLGDGGTVTLAVSYTQTETGGATTDALDRFHAMPASSEERWCEVEHAGRVLPGWVRPQGCTVMGTPDILEGQRTLRWGWRMAHAPAAGVIDLQGAHHMESSTVHLKGVQLVATGAQGTHSIETGEGVALGAADVPPWPDEGVGTIPAYSVGWRVTTAGGKDVIPNRESLLQQLETGALAASLPEPGLGLGFKGRKSDLSVVPEVLAKVRLQVTRGALPGMHPLKPRRLMKARRSRWATPWEQAILLTRYLGQLKIPARPIPVRPRALGVIEDAVPHGYEEAVVRVATDDGPIWLDPACSICGVGEVRPELWGGQVLAVGMDRLPTGEMATRSQTIDWRMDTPTVTIDLAGAEALALRRALAAVPMDRRAEAVPRLVGLAGASLLRHTGISSRGGEISLHLTLPANADSSTLASHLPSVETQGSTMVDLGWALERTDRTVVAADDPAWAHVEDQQLEAGPISWSRSVTTQDEVRTVTDRWVWTQPDVSRVDAVRVLGAAPVVGRAP